ANAEKARLSRILVQLKEDVPVEHAFSAFTRREVERDRLLAFLKENQFRSLIARVESKGCTATAGASAPAMALAATPGATPAVTLATASEPRPAQPAPEARYELVSTPEALDRWIAEATASGLVAFDTETDSLDATRAQLVGVSLGLGSGRACYIPIAHRRAGAEGTLDLGDGVKGGLLEGQLSLVTVIERLKPVLADPAVLKIGHNIKYDMIVLARHGADIAPIDDTMLISYVLEGGAHGHGMDELADLHLAHKTIT